MKKLILSILVSIICILLNATSTIKSTNFQETSELKSLQDTPSVVIKSLENSEIDLSVFEPEKLDSQPTEASTTYNIYTPPLKNKNNFYYRGTNILNIDKDLVHVLDSTFNNDTLYNYLEEYLSVYAEYTNKITHSFNSEYKKFQREKQLEATAYLAWPTLLILCLIVLIIYYKKEDPAEVTPIAALLLIASIIGTIMTFPDILILIQGAEYSVINSIGS